MKAAADEPSDLVKLKRRTGRAMGRAESRDRARPGAEDQAVSHGWHLALSLAAGAAYGAAKPDTASPLVAGSMFGAEFYALA